MQNRYVAWEAKMRIKDRKLGTYDHKSNPDSGPLRIRNGELEFNSSDGNWYKTSISRVGCLHWALFSILYLFGIEIHVSWVLPIDKTKSYYKLDGLFCLISVVYAAFVLGAGIYVQENYSIRYIIYRYQALFPIISVFIAANIAMLIIILISPFFGNRFLRYLLNYVLLQAVLLVVMPFVASFSFLRIPLLIAAVVAEAIYLSSDIFAGDGIYVHYNNNDDTASHSSSYSRSSSAPSQTTDWDKKMREEAEAREAAIIAREDAERQANKLEDERRRIKKEISKHEDNIDRLKRKNEGYENAIREHRKGTIGYGYIDPKVCKNDIDKNMREIQFDKQQIAKLEEKLSKL